jgi:(p)ppGpp synthase/HD superfamily hydrolase
VYNSLFLENIFQHAKCAHFTEKEKEQVRIAYKLASELHLNQERLDGKAYIEHIDRSIGLYLNKTLYANEQCVPNNLIALILHDCIEDNQNGLIEIIKKKFDIEVTLDILWMSKPTASVIDQV